MLELDKIYNMDCLDGMKQIDDASADLLLTDSPYGLSFMGKDWDKAVPNIAVWKECYRVLKPGSFAFVMCIPRQDCLSRMIVNLGDAGFNMGFTPIFWTYASGFPKSQNIGLTIDKQECRKQLTKKLGRKPTKEEFTEAWKTFREVVGKEKVDIGMQSGSMHAGRPVNVVERDKTIATSPQAKALDGSYAGFQPKPAVEIIIVAMKPLSEKTYVDQALKNMKGITWLGDCKIPYLSKEDKKGARYGTQADFRGGNLKGDKKPWDVYGKNILASSDGRFPANLLVSDDMLNDGKERKSGKNNIRRRERYFLEHRYGDKDVEQIAYGDSGSFSRYFDLDSWFNKQMGDLSLDMQNTFPFIAVPKASKGEKDKGLEHSPTKDIPYSGYRKEYDSTKSWVSEYPDGEKRPMNRMKNNHPTVKPLKLMSYLVVLGSREEDIVLDPYMGSGTTGLACKLLNRRYIGFENNTDYYKIAQARLSADIKKYRVHVDKKLIKDDEPESEPPEKDYATRLDDWV